MGQPRHYQARVGHYALRALDLLEGRRDAVEPLVGRSVSDSRIKWPGGSFGVAPFPLPTIRDPYRKKAKSARLLDAMISFRHLYPQFFVKVLSLQRAAGGGNLLCSGTP
jgi:hypothetical protein